MPVISLFDCQVFLVIMFWPQRRPQDSVWKEQHVFITGGSDGIGLALATVFLERKAKVTIASRSESKLAAARNALKEHVGSKRLFSCAVDVGEWKEVIYIPAPCSSQNFPILTPYGRYLMLFSC